MKLALAGLPGSGKSTLLAALLGRFPTGGRGRSEGNLALLNIPDERLDRLVALYESKKITPAQISYMDPAAPVVRPEDPSTRLAPELRQSDGLIEVLRNFDGGLGAPHPAADHRAFQDELLLADLILVENRLERIDLGRQRGQKGDPEEMALLEQARTALSQEQPLRDLPELAGHVKLRGFMLLTAKPTVLVVNNEDEDPHPPDLPGLPDPLVVRARIEAELAELPADERAEFLTDLGIQEDAFPRLIQAGFKTLDLITFYTAGPSEARAWTLRRGATVLEAAGTIHSDMEKGFIRAEVMGYEDLIREGSEPAVKKAGLMKLVGREYVVQDGDILYIRFNV